MRSRSNCTGRSTFFMYLTLFLFMICIPGVNASDKIISGSAYFECSLGSKYMQKHGYSYVDEILHDNDYKTNVFGAKDAEVTVKDDSSNVIGEVMTDKDGKFSLRVPEESSYEVVITFHDEEIKSVVSASETDGVSAHFGFFSSEKVGNWIDSAIDW